MGLKTQRARLLAEAETKRAAYEAIHRKCAPNIAMAQNGLLTPQVARQYGLTADCLTRAIVAGWIVGHRTRAKGGIAVFLERDYQELEAWLEWQKVLFAYKRVCDDPKSRMQCAPEHKPFSHLQGTDWYRKVVLRAAPEPDQSATEEVLSGNADLRGMDEPIDSPEGRGDVGVSSGAVRVTQNEPSALPAALPAVVRAAPPTQAPASGAHESAELTDELLSDYETFIETHMRVRNEAGKVVPVVLRKHQRDYCRLRKACRDRGEQVRTVELKPRQIGSSAKKLWCIGVDMLRYPGSRVAIIADRLAVSYNTARHYLYEPLCLLAEEFPEIRISKFKATTTDPAFVLWPDETDRRTEVWILTANADSKTSRSFTFQFVFATEVAYWARATKNTDTEQADRVFDALMQTVPDKWMAPQASVDVESTADGAVGAFYDACMKAQAGLDDWTFVFVPWFDSEKYCVPGDFPKEDRLLGELRRGSETAAEELGMDKDEVDLALNYRELTWGQIKWRREDGIPKRCKGRKHVFQREYPSNATEAFQSTGFAVFDSTALEWLQANTVADGVPFVIVPESDTSYRLEAHSGYDPNFVVWAPPQKGMNYVIGCDVSFGIASMFDETTVVSKRDRSVASVFCRETGEEVAIWRGVPLPEEFGDTVDAIGRLYNNAIVNVERNSPGYSTIVRLQQLRYPALYMFIPEDMAYGAHPVIGTPITAGTRGRILDVLRLMIKQHHMKIRDLTTVMEMKAMQAVGGRITTIRSGHDDHVFSKAHAAMVLYDRSPTLATEGDNWTDAGMMRPPEGCSVAFDLKGRLRVQPDGNGGVYDKILHPWRN